MVRELRRRGYAAHDADDGFAEPRADGRWGWRVDRVADLLALLRRSADLVLMSTRPHAELVDALLEHIAPVSPSRT